MHAQTTASIPSAEEIEAGGGRKRALEGYYFFDGDEGPETLMLVLGEVTVFPPLKFKNKKEEQFYWKTETYEYIETFPTQKEREEHLKKMEGAVFEQYKPVLKKFTKSQAQMLIKLINRETNQSSYNILKAFLGSFRAGFWQTFGRFFGVNLIRAHPSPLGREAPSAAKPLSPLPSFSSAFVKSVSAEAPS